MALIMLLIMGKMYPDKKLNGIIIVASIVVFVTTLSLLRTQTPVSDVQYMKAMIPHHSSAIMTSKNANIKDPEVKKLSEGIIASQEKCSRKDQKEFMKDLKPVYQAISKEEAEMNREKLVAKWGKKYPVVLSSWQRNWDKLTTYFKYPADIRKLIYTTNTIEGYHRQIRKVTKTKGAFTSDMALLKLMYLATNNIQKKWTMPLQNWSVAISQPSIIFGCLLYTSPSPRD